MSEQTFYVYEHWRTDKNEPFYVGKGQKRRAYHMHATTRNDYHRFIQEKLKRIGASVEVRIVMKDLSEIEAFREETRRIIFWRSQGCTLANFTDGGEGFSGGRHSEEWCRELSSKAKIWWQNPQFRESILSKTRGLKRTEEQKAKLRKPKSVEHIEAMKRAAKDRKRPIPRTAEHTKNIITGVKAAWQKKNNDSSYVAARDERRATKKTHAFSEKLRLKEQREFEAAQLRFKQFINALIDGTERRCADCRITKAPEQFTTDNHTPNGRHAYCKSCCARRQHEIREKKKLQGSV
jgi:hypothetical protein